MGHHARVAWLGGPLLLGACLVPENPPWVIDVPVPWAIQTVVVKPGPYSAGLVVPADRTRAEPLPLDEVEVRWFDAAPPGATLRPPVWIAQPQDLGLFYVYGLYDFDGAEPLACPDPLPLTVLFPCRLGEGERVRFTLGDPLTLLEMIYYYGDVRISLLAVASSDATLDPGECVRRLYDAPRAGLEDCLIARGELFLGPRGLLWASLPADRRPITFDELPPEIFLEPVSTNPVFAQLRVERESDAGTKILLASDGDTIEVRAGETITVTAKLAPDATYFDLHVDDETMEYIVVPEDSDQTVIARLTQDVDGYVDSGVGLTHRWVAPDTAEPLRLYLQAKDQHAGMTSAMLQFVTTRGDP